MKRVGVRDRDTHMMIQFYFLGIKNSLLVFLINHFK